MKAISLGEQGQKHYGSTRFPNRFFDIAISSESSNNLTSLRAAISFNCTKLSPTVSNREFNDWPSTLPRLFLDWIQHDKGTRYRKLSSSRLVSSVPRVCVQSHAPRHSHRGCAPLKAVWLTIRSQIVQQHSRQTQMTGASFQWMAASFGVTHQKHVLLAVGPMDLRGGCSFILRSSSSWPAALSQLHQVIAPIDGAFFAIFSLI